MVRPGPDEPGSIGPAGYHGARVPGPEHVSDAHAPVPEPVPRPPLLGGILAVLAALAGAIFASGLLVSLAVAAGAHTNDAAYTAAGFAGEWVGFVGVPVYLSRTRGTRRMSTDFGLRFGGPGDIGLGVAAGLLAYGVVEVYAAVLQALGNHADLGHEATQLSGHGLGFGFLVFGLTAAIGAPLAEEVFFRGLAQPAFQRYLGGVGGWVLAGVLFGFAHVGANPMEAIGALVFVGLVLGALFWRTGRLGPGIVAHMTFNGITVVALALSR